jgi:hypothetical protein
VIISFLNLNCLPKSVYRASLLGRSCVCACVVHLRTNDYVCVCRIAMDLSRIVFSVCGFESVTVNYRWRVCWGIGVSMRCGWFYCVVTFLYLVQTRWILHITAGLTFINSPYCSHNAFMCFVWFSEQTATISVYSTRWWVLITQTKRSPPVRSGSLNIR